MLDVCCIYRSLHTVKILNIPELYTQIAKMENKVMCFCHNFKGILSRSGTFSVSLTEKGKYINSVEEHNPL